MAIQTSLIGANENMWEIEEPGGLQKMGFEIYTGLMKK